MDYWFRTTGMLGGCCFRIWIGSGGPSGCTVNARYFEWWCNSTAALVSVRIFGQCLARPSTIAEKFKRKVEVGECTLALKCPTECISGKRSFDLECSCGTFWICKYGRNGHGNTHSTKSCSCSRKLRLRLYCGRLRAFYRFSLSRNRNRARHSFMEGSFQPGQI